MKYTRLTKEQFESLEQEFITFLAAQSITGEEWKQIKETTPEVAEQELDVFSDLVWEGVLQNASYLENIAPQQLFLFELGETSMNLIVLKITDAKQDVTTPEGYRWLQKNFASDDVEFLTANKEYSDDRNGDVFALIQQGAVITKGELFNFFDRTIHP